MTVSKIAAVVLLASSIASFGWAAQAEEPAMTPAMVEQLDLAATLTNYGIERKDPLLLLAAARVLKTVAPEGAAAVAGSEYGPDQLIAKAKEIAGTDSEIEAIADDIAAQGSRGLCYGPGTYYGCF